MEIRKKGRRPAGVLIGAMLLLAVGSGVWWWGRDRPQNLERRSDTPPLVAGASGTDSRRAAAPLPQGLFRDIHAELVVRARAGDAQAAFRLGQILGRCLDYESIPDGPFAEMLARAAAPGGSGVRVGGRKVDDPDLLDTMLYAKDEADAICRGVGELPASVRKGDARAWLELAADRGNTKAMVEYGAVAFADFASDADLLDNAVEVAARRERARGYLRRAFEAGEPASLPALAAAHGHRPYLGRDMTEALAYWNAYRRTAEGRRLPEGVVKFAQAQWLGQASPQQIRDSQRRSVEILQAFQQHRARR